VFNRHGIKRLAATAFAALVTAGVLAAGTASAQDVAKADSAKAKAPRVEKSYEERRAEDGPWAKGANWLQFGAGYARAGGKNAGDGLGGYGVAYHRLLSNRWSFGASVRHEILGHLGPSYEISVPFTAEFVRHYKWRTAMRPYLGFGGGYYFHKYYRTASDYTGAPGAGWHLCTGTNLPIDDRHMLGLDARVGFVAGRGGTVVNPVFGPEGDTETQWSIKVNWALVH
jgi:hypothetical protein